jgi:hypothetical protein
MFWGWNCGMLGLEEGQEMGWMKRGESMDLWLAMVQAHMAWVFRWRSDMVWFQLSL